MLTSLRLARHQGHDPAFGGGFEIRERGHREIAADAWIAAEAGDALRIAHAHPAQSQTLRLDLIHVTHRELLGLARVVRGAKKMGRLDPGAPRYFGNRIALSGDPGNFSGIAYSAATCAGRIDT